MIARMSSDPAAVGSDHAGAELCTGAVDGFIASGNAPFVWTCGAGATPGAMMNVSMVKRPLNTWKASPFPLVSTSP
jgi:hypothetical protein